MLSKYNWPGNVRELENLVYRSAVMAPGETILIKDLPQEIVQAVAKPILKLPNCPPLSLYDAAIVVAGRGGASFGYGAGK